MWYFEAAARNYFVEIRWLLLTTGLESLVHIKDERLHNKSFARPTKVFVDRLLALGGIDCTFAVSEEDLIKMYKERSMVAHGISIGSLDPEKKSLYRREENLLRDILRKALLEPNFAAIFQSNASVQSHLPLR
jgi:hypothetical protein